MSERTGWFSELANKAARGSGRASTFGLAAGTIIVWLVSGPFFGFSDTWQLVINTGTTIVTFLMVFLIQNSQNRDSAAIQVKLDEIIRAGRVHNKFVGIENLDDDELERIKQQTESDAAHEVGDEAVRVTGERAADAARRAT